MLGAIGVIISIVYLATQIRNQNKESQRQAMTALTTHLEWFESNARGESWNGRAVASCSAIFWWPGCEVKAEVRCASLGRLLRFADSLYLNVLDGTLDKRLWRGYEQTIADTVAYPGFQTWWATRKHWHTDEFCAQIDRHIQTLNRQFMTATTKIGTTCRLRCRPINSGLGRSRIAPSPRLAASRTVTVTN